MLVWLALTVWLDKARCPRTGPAWGPPPRAATGCPGGPGARRPPHSPGCRPCRPRTRAAAPTRAAPSPRRCRARTTPSSTCPPSLRARGDEESGDAACALKRALAVPDGARGGTDARVCSCCERQGRGAMRDLSQSQTCDLAQRCPDTGLDAGLSCRNAFLPYPTIPYPTHPYSARLRPGVRH